MQKTLKSVVTALGQGMSTFLRQPIPESENTVKDGKTNETTPVMWEAFGNRLLIQRFLYCDRCGAPLSCIQKDHGRVEVDCVHTCRPSQAYKAIAKRGTRG